jgi:2-polyprenyl-3-methyl-5-hydroxy-6-metoxy-1,4-benzoquinol methylase
MELLSEPTTSSNGYHSRMRLDVLAQVPSSAKRVLSVGCAMGITEAEMVKRGVEVVGIEYNATAAAAARENGLHVVEGDACTIESELLGSDFDCLIYADVLEHLADPAPMLCRHAELLRPGGVVIVSVPNFRHYSVFWQLFVQGRVQYADAGIMDRTHVRLTTRRLVEQWLRDAGLRDITASYWSWRRRERLAMHCTLGLAREFAATQVMLTAKKPA